MTTCHLFQLAEKPTDTDHHRETADDTRAVSATAFTIACMEDAATPDADDDVDAFFKAFMDDESMDTPADSTEENDDDDDEDDDSDQKIHRERCAMQQKRIRRDFRRCSPVLHTPFKQTTEEYCRENGLIYLAALDSGLMLAIIRKRLGEEIFRAFCLRRLFHEIFEATHNYLNDILRYNCCRIDDALRAEAVQAVRDARRVREDSMQLHMSGSRAPFRLCGRHELSRFFNENVIDIVNNIPRYRRYGIKFPQPFILEGAPGCGKTYAVERLAEHLGWKTFFITTSSIGTGVIHETAKNIERTFEEAAAYAPSLVIIDEVDAFVPDRTVNNKDFVCEEVASFLRVLQHAQENYVLVVGLTNRIESIDSAVLRTGRLGTHINVGLPEKEEVRELLEFHLMQKPHADLDLNRYAERLTQGALSDVTYVVDEAAMSAARRRAARIEPTDMETAFAHLHRNSARKENTRRSMGFNAD